MRTHLIPVAVAVLVVATACATVPKGIAQKVVASEMARCPDPAQLDGMQGKLKWNYTTGLELLSMLDVYEKTGDKAILDYVDSWYDAIVAEDGTVKANYKRSNHNLDHICPARTLLKLHDITGREKYRKAIDFIAMQLREQPRTSEGGFWHKQVYPHQMWLDGLYMAEPFYAEHTTRYEAPEKRAAAYEDICKQFLIIGAHTFDHRTELFRHAWDESRSMFWADRKTGQSAHAWGRALGWYCMALVDVLPFIPEETPGRIELSDLLRDIMEKVSKYADPKTGMWYQVIDSPGKEGNWLESTCSAMFTYTYLKGVRTGELDASWSDYALKCYKNLVKTFVGKDRDGLLELRDCCAVAGLGGKENRSGTYEYYIGEKKTTNDPKGLGPLVWAALEAER